VPRKKIVDAKESKPYINADGTLDFNKIFKFQAKQTELLRNVSRNGKVYLQPAAGQCLSTGGIRSGKTCGWVMFFVMHYCLRWKGCNLLVLRRNFKELENGAIADFRHFMPKELYEYDSTKHVATLMNGSRVVFGHCQNNKDRDIEQYLGQAFPAIVVDECGQFSPDAWMMLFQRNIVNPACERDEAGNLPIPAIVGCTNPLGPHYEYYRTLFVQKEPWNPGEDAKRDPVDGTWWTKESGEWAKIYDPQAYAYQRSTVMDNPELLARDPGIIDRLMSMPKAKRDKVLYGYDGQVEGQYFDCFDPSYHVINLREEPEAIIWQEYQPVWAGEDWGMQHANATYLFTKAMVRDSVGDNYKLKTVCFQEIVVTGGKTMDELASIISAKAKLPNGNPVKLKAIYFSHEKFNRQMDNRTPADEYSRALKLVGLPPVTSATRDRIGSASLMYNMIKKGEIVILDTCKEIILAIPSLMRNPDLLDDVLKVDAKGDDCYDGFRYGLYGHLGARKKPEKQAEAERVEELKKKDPLAAHFLKMKLDAEHSNHTASFKPSDQPVWLGKAQ
jgi:Terminase large subunit, T4likevirus-type, N-terminal